MLLLKAANIIMMLLGDVDCDASAGQQRARLGDRTEVEVSTGSPTHRQGMHGGSSMSTQAWVAR